MEFTTFAFDNPRRRDEQRRTAAGAEIARIYLLRPCRGRGVGQRLLGAAETGARSLSFDYLWLDAMKSAEAVWRTYERWDFQRVGDKLFDKPVATTERPMVVLTRQLIGGWPDHCPEIERMSDALDRKS